jgi:hypothetical protein
MTTAHRRSAGHEEVVAQESRVPIDLAQDALRF